GNIFYQSQSTQPFPFSVVGDQQILVECHNALQNNALNQPNITGISLHFGPPINFNCDNGQLKMMPDYDMYVRVYSRNGGNAVGQGNYGGLHEGNPMDSNSVSQRPGKLTLCQLASKRTPLVFMRDSMRGTADSFTLYDDGFGAVPKGAQGKAQNV